MQLLYLVAVMGVIASFVLGLVSRSWMLVVVAIACLAYLTVKARSGLRRSGSLRQLQEAYDQLDQQAKVVIRTDLELHRIQEELDRRLASLMSLHQLGRQLQIGLHPEEIFSTLTPTLATNFGFAKGLLGVCRTFDATEWRSTVGVTADTASAVRAHLVDSRLLPELLDHPAPRLLHADAATPAEQRLLELLDCGVVVLAGVLPHAGPAGCLLLGRITGGTNTQTDVELVSLLTNHLAVAVENSALFERSWAAQQALERKVHERTRELADANTQLVRLNKAKSDFVSAVSHELRTPLAAIKGYAALLDSGQFGPLSAPQQERIAKVEKHADLLTQLINNLLDIARIESGRVTMESRRLPADELLAGVQELVQPQLDAKRLRFTVERRDVSHLLGDPQHLQRVLVNLLSNAIKYTPEGGRIGLALIRQDGDLLLTVSDTGCGIAPENQAKLFQEFYRADDAVNQRVPGTGLGLALVKRIVEAHHGRIAISSEPGKGTTVSVHLPTAEPPMTNAPAEGRG